MQFYIFLIITVLLIVKPTVNALFLSKLGAEHLPYGYMLVAGVAVFTSYYYNKALRAFSLFRVTIISLIIFSLSFIALAMVLQFDVLNSWVLYVYYLGVSLFAVIATSQFWILANIVFNTREAKRLFDFIGAGAIAGGVFGGYLTSIIVSSFGNVYAILLAALLMLCCIPIIKKIWSLRIIKLNKYIRKQRKYYNGTNGESSLKIVAKSEHLTYLALITGIGVLVAKLVDFQFSDFANRAIADADDLASFFGFWFSTFNVVALTLQLFLTNRLLSKLGVSSTLLILPIGVVLASALLLVFPELWVLIIIKGIDGSLKQSLNKAAVELSIMPIPFQIKNQAKSFIDVAVDSIATGFAGLLLVFVIRKLDLGNIYVTILILALSTIWIVLIFKLRKAYFNSFRLNIQRNLITESTNIKSRNSETTVDVARSILISDNEADILEMLNRLSQYKITALKSEIIDLLKHPSNQIKESVVKQLYIYDKGTAFEEVKTLVHANDAELVNTVLEYIFHHSDLTHNTFFKAYLDHENKYISNAALLCLSKEAVNDGNIAIKYNLVDRIIERIKNVNDSGENINKGDISSLLITIAYSGLSKYYAFIQLALNNTRPYVVKHAIKAAGITVDEQFIEPLLGFLSNKRFRMRAIRALKSYGPQMTQTILKMDKKEDLADDVKRFLPRVIESNNTQSAVKVLMRLLKSKDIVIRFEAAKSLNKLKSKNENLNFNKRIFRNEIVRECRFSKDTLDIMASIQDIIKASELESSEKSGSTSEILSARQSIIGVLEDQLEMSLKCIFKLLSLVYAEADIKVSYSGLVSDVKEARVNALEFLDNLLQSQLKTQVLPLVEYYIIDRSNLNDTDIKLKLYSENDYITMLLKKRGKRIKLELLNLISNLNDKSYLSQINLLRKHQNKDVKVLADKTYDKLFTMTKS